MVRVTDTYSMLDTYLEDKDYGYSLIVKTIECDRKYIGYLPSIKALRQYVLDIFTKDNGVYGIYYSNHPYVKRLVKYCFRMLCTKKERIAYMMTDTYIIYHFYVHKEYNHKNEDIDSLYRHLKDRLYKSLLPNK